MCTYDFDYKDYPQNFITAIRFVLSHEGGYVNDPDDPGGETKYGISKRSFPDVDIKSLTIDDAVSLYYKNYYTPIDKTFEFNNYNYKISTVFSLIMLDSVVQHGIFRSVKFLQYALKNYYTTIKADGIAGKNTLHTLDKVIDSVDFGCFAAGLISVRLKFYSQITRLRKSNLKFLPGWVNRVASLCTFISTVG